MSNDLILFSVHQLNSFVDHIQTESSFSFGQDGRGSRFVPVLSLSEKHKKINSC